jgi:hypothetical protein
MPKRKSPHDPEAIVKKSRRASKSKVKLKLEGVESTRSATLVLPLLKYCENQDVTDKLERLSIIGGRWRHLVGLFSNYVASLRGEKTPIAPIPSGLQSFYNQCWASLEAARDPNFEQLYREKVEKYFRSQERGNNASIPKDPPPFLQEAYDFLGLGLQGALPDDIQVHLREPITRDMGKTLKMSSEDNLLPRLKAWIRYSLIVDPESDFASLDSGGKGRRETLWEKAIQNFTIEGLNARELHWINMLMEHMRGVLVNIDGERESMVTEARIKYESEVLRFQRKERKSEPKSPSLPTRGKIFGSLLRRRPQLFFPVLCFISNSNEDRLDEDRIRREAEENNNKPKERKGKRVKMPGAFSLLPQWKLQPAFMEYASTQLKSSFGETDPNVFLGRELLWDKLPNRAKRRLQRFNINNFYTNGVEICINLVCDKSKFPEFINSDDLLKRGYSLSEKGPVHPVTGSRGVYIMREKRNDSMLVDLPTEAPILVMDPGTKDVISVRVTSFGNTASPREIIDKGKVWSVSNIWYGGASGRRMSMKREKARRKRCNGAYGKCIENLGEVRRRSVRLEPYISTLGAEYEVLKNELCSRGRRKTRMLSNRLQQSCVDKIAERICKDSDGGVVAFGDGTFGASRGHAPCPRKQLQRAIAVKRPMFMLGEWGTSKYCPGGCKGEMENVVGEYRVRRCKTGSGDATHHSCHLFSEEKGTFTCDRDESATCNMTQCVRNSIRGVPWPSHLQRPY